MESRSPGPRRRQLGRALALLLASCSLGACVAQPGGPGYGRLPSGSSAALPTPVGRRIALLLPLSGANAPVGQAMLQAARLAFDPGGMDGVDTQDTKGTPEGAAAAANAAATGGAGLLVGPLTTAETAAVTPVATGRSIPVLALTSDASKGQPGVWPLGLTPEQQARTLVRACLLDGRRRIAAILPSNPFGDSLAAGLGTAMAEVGLPAPNIMRYQGQSGLESAIVQMGRSGGAPGAPPAIDALLLGSPADLTLRMAPALAAAGLSPDRVRLLGTALWGREAPRLASLAPAWFAAAPTDTLKVFEDNFIAHYGTPPRDITSVAFDAAAVARAARGPSGINVATLVNPAGFAGANGLFRLLPDGTVRRTLAVFEIGSGGVRMRDMPMETAAPSM